MYLGAHLLVLFPASSRIWSIILDIRVRVCYLLRIAFRRPVYTFLRQHIALQQYLALLVQAELFGLQIVEYRSVFGRVELARRRVRVLFAKKGGRKGWKMNPCLLYIEQICL